MAGESQQLPGNEPDPTVITTEIINKEIMHLRELLEAQIVCTNEVIVEKFARLDERLVRMEHSRVEHKTDTQLAVDSALASQKEAVREQTASAARAIAKSEEVTAKSISQLSDTFTALQTGLQASISDLKERVARIENVKAGRAEQSSAMVAFVGFIVSLIVIGGFVAAAWPR